MSIPELKAEQSRKQEDHLKSVVRKERAEVEKRTSELALSLTAETEKKLRELSGNVDILGKAAT